MAAFRIADLCHLFLCGLIWSRYAVKQRLGVDIPNDLLSDGFELI